MTRPEGMTWVVSWQTLGRPQEQTFDTELEAEQWAAKQINKQWTLTTPYVIWER